MDQLLPAYVAVRSRVVTLRHSMDERGEGVISAAIAVLIMAVLGATMWLLYNAMFSDAVNRTTGEVQKIGN